MKNSTDSPRLAVLVTGPPGSGKTLYLQGLLKNLKHRLPDLNVLRIVVYTTRPKRKGADPGRIHVTQKEFAQLVRENKILLPHSWRWKKDTKYYYGLDVSQVTKKYNAPTLLVGEFLPQLLPMQLELLQEYGWHTTLVMMFPKLPFRLEWLFKRWVEAHIAESVREYVFAMEKSVYVNPEFIWFLQDATLKFYTGNFVGETALTEDFWQRFHAGEYTHAQSLALYSYFVVNKFKNVEALPVLYTETFSLKLNKLKKLKKPLQVVDYLDKLSINWAVERTLVKLAETSNLGKKLKVNKTRQKLIESFYKSVLNPYQRKLIEGPHKLIPEPVRAGYKQPLESFIENLPANPYLEME